MTEDHQQPLPQAFAMVLRRIEVQPRVWQIESMFFENMMQMPEKIAEWRASGYEVVIYNCLRTDHVA